jgi:hypothetical protein
VFKALVRARDSMSAILKILDSIHVVTRDLAALKAGVGGMGITRWAEGFDMQPRGVGAFEAIFNVGGAECVRKTWGSVVAI